jgi:hypothetical protein
MLLNLSTLRSELGQKIKNTSVSNARRDRWLNLSQDDIASEMDPDHLIVNSTFSTVADTRKYYLDYEFNKILSIVDETNDLTLRQAMEPELESVDPSREDSGSPFLYSVFGYEWVTGQPTSASVITVVSNSGSDTTQKVRINGLVNGVEDTELLTLNGLTDVNGTKSFTEVFTIAKDETTVGMVTVTSNAAAVTIAQLGHAELAGPRQGVHLFPVPDSALTLRVRGIRRPREMLNTEDYPDFPETFHELVLIGAAVRGHRDLMRPSIAKETHDNEYEPMLKKLQKQMGNKRGRQSSVIRGVNPSLARIDPGRLPPEFGVD